MNQRIVPMTPFHASSIWCALKLTQEFYDFFVVVDSLFIVAHIACGTLIGVGRYCFPYNKGLLL